MKPISVSVQVDRPRDEVFVFLDVLANHERFIDHMLVDWTLSGPAAGAGAKVRLRAALPGPKDWLELEVLESVAPERLVEETVGAKGRRRTCGTYTLEVTPDGGTLIRFELVFLYLRPHERLLAPLLRGWLARANAKAMVRLGEELAPPAPARLRSAA